VAPETRTSINNPFGDSHALNFNAQERGEWQSRGVSGIGQRAKSVRGSGLSEEVVVWMTGRAKIINVGNMKGREVVEEKEVENEVVEKVEVGKRESWEDAESLVMNEKSGRSVEGKERAESLIEEPTGRREVELGAKEERRNNTKSVAFERNFIFYRLNEIYLRTNAPTQSISYTVLQFKIRARRRRVEA
jgi:hypothetical protein